MKTDQDPEYDPAKALAEERSRECQDRLSKRKYAAVVRTSDYRIVVPIVRFKDGRFGPSVPMNLRSVIQPKPKKSLERAIFGIREEILKAGFLMGHGRVTAVVQMAPARNTAPRIRNAHAKGEALETSDKKYINPKIHIKGAGWLFVAVPLFLYKIPGMTPFERECYAWLVWKADDDGIARISLRELASPENMNCRLNTLMESIKSMKLRGLLDSPYGQRKKKETRFCWHPFMDHSATESDAEFPPSASLSVAEFGRSATFDDADFEVPIITNKKHTRKNDYSSRGAESELLDLLEEKLGKPEMVKNGGAWEWHWIKRVWDDIWMAWRLD